MLDYILVNVTEFEVTDTHARCKSAIAVMV